MHSAALCYPGRRGGQLEDSSRRAAVPRGSLCAAAGTLLDGLRPAAAAAAAAPLGRSLLHRLGVCAAAAQVGAHWHTAQACLLLRCCRAGAPTSPTCAPWQCWCPRPTTCTEPARRKSGAQEGEGVCHRAGGTWQQQGLVVESSGCGGCIGQPHIPLPPLPIKVRTLPAPSLHTPHPRHKRPMLRPPGRPPGAAASRWSAPSTGPGGAGCPSATPSSRACWALSRCCTARRCPCCCAPRSPETASWTSGTRTCRWGSSSSLPPFGSGATARWVGWGWRPAASRKQCPAGRGPAALLFLLWLVVCVRVVVWCVGDAKHVQAHCCSPAWATHQHSPSNSPQGLAALLHRVRPCPASRRRPLANASSPLPTPSFHSTQPLPHPLQALRLFPVSIIMPILQIVWVLFSIISGSLYYQVRQRGGAEGRGVQGGREGMEGAWRVATGCARVEVLKVGMGTGRSFACCQVPCAALAALCREAPTCAALRPSAGRACAPCPLRLDGPPWLPASPGLPRRSTRR